MISVVSSFFFCSNKSVVSASMVNLNNGSVCEALTLNHQLSYSTVTPVKLLSVKGIVKKSLKNGSYANTVDIYFTLLCIYFTLKLGLDKPKDVANPIPEHLKLLEDLMPFLDEHLNVVVILTSPK